MRQEVPQFIDIEDKVIGPLSFRQFIYLVGGAGLGYVAYKLVPVPINFLLTPVGPALGLLLAFYKKNGRPFLEVAQSAMRYQLRGKLYLWRHIPKPKPKPEEIIAEKTIAAHAKPDVDTLARNLDIMDRTRINNS